MSAFGLLRQTVESRNGPQQQYNSVFSSSKTSMSIPSSVTGGTTFTSSVPSTISMDTSLFSPSSNSITDSVGNLVKNILSSITSNFISSPDTIQTTNTMNDPSSAFCTTPSLLSPIIQQEPLSSHFVQSTSNFIIGPTDIYLPFNITHDKEASDSLMTTNSVLEYVGISVCVLVCLFYLVTLFLLVRNRKNYFLSLWPSRVIALVGAIVHSFIGVIILLFQQPWWTEIKNTNTSYDSTSISNNIACRILLPFEFFGFVLSTCAVLFIISHTLTPRKKTENNAVQVKSIPKSPTKTTTTGLGEELKETSKKLTRSTSVVDVIIGDEVHHSSNRIEPLNSVAGITIDDGSVKPLLRSNSSSKGIEFKVQPGNVERNFTRRKSESHKSPSETSSNKEEPSILLEVPSASPRSTSPRDSRPSFIKHASSPLLVQEFQKAHLMIDVKKENLKIFIRALVLTAFFSVLQIITIIVDVVLSYNIQHHQLEFIYSHVTRYGGYCACPISSLLIYIAFYFSFFITFNFYSLKLYRKLINKRLKKKVLACQVIITTLFTIFGIFGKSGEVLFTIIQSINVEPTSLLFDVLVRFFNVVNYIGCDILVCFTIVVYFVFIPLLETLETAKFYESNKPSFINKLPNPIQIVSSPTKLLIHDHAPETRV